MATSPRTWRRLLPPTAADSSASCSSLIGIDPTRVLSPAGDLARVVRLAGEGVERGAHRVLEPFDCGQHTPLRIHEPVIRDQHRRGARGPYPQLAAHHP